MTAVDAARFVRACRARGLGLWSGVPCSFLTPLIDFVIDHDALRYVPAANEGDAVAIAAGAWLGGGGGVAMMQNSGLGNAVNPLTSLAHVFRIPMLLIVTLRGDPDGAPDEPQHALMGPITTAQLELMRVPWRYFPADGDIEGALDAAQAHFDTHRTPFALVLRKDSVAPYVPQRSAAAPRQTALMDTRRAGAASVSRHAVLAAVQATAAPHDVVLATTGHTGRELYALDDRPNQFYMAGSMGCVSSLGLGLALTRPTTRVIVVDGDGALLMRMGTCATVGHERPPNLVHLVLDNGQYASTGGQATVSSTVDFAALAAACGYARVSSVTCPEEVGHLLEERAPGPHFIYVPITPSEHSGLPRPRLSPAETADRLRATLSAHRTEKEAI